MERQTPLSEFLRARRRKLQPDDVGLPRGPRRRVDGLRREEVATLAGISADYYVRLEQGRDSSPSAQVVDSLARALQLDEPTTAHLHRLAVPRPRRGTTGVTRPQRGLRDLLTTLDTTVSAFIQDQLFNVVDSNTLARALTPTFTVGGNVIRSAFLDPTVRSLYDDWDQVSREAVAGLRATAGAAVNDPAVAELVADLSKKSSEFRDLWKRHEVVPKEAGRRTLHHPVVGRLELHHEKLLVPGTGGLMLVLHHAEPGTSSARAFAELAFSSSGLPRS